MEFLLFNGLIAFLKMTIPALILSYFIWKILDVLFNSTLTKKYFFKFAITVILLNLIYVFFFSKDTPKFVLQETNVIRIIEESEIKNLAPIIDSDEERMRKLEKNISKNIIK
ncbi:MAG: hypothetical protein COA52_00935 [Hyphomicrobiales bacterium]|nr:MAG: hypothetical protein COA52_00935 [Hyphomicrobiales bacterium]